MNFYHKLIRHKVRQRITKNLTSDLKMGIIEHMPTLWRNLYAELSGKVSREIPLELRWAEPIIELIPVPDVEIK